jgi:hypothetical protein
MSSKQQTSVPVDLQTLQQMDAAFQGITLSIWTVREYEEGGGDEELIKWTEINDGSAAQGNSEPEIITHESRTRTSIANFNFLALAQRIYPTLSQVSHTMLRNEKHPSFENAKIIVAELDQFFAKTSNGSWEISEYGFSMDDPMIVTPRGNTVFAMCAGEVGDTTQSMKDARFACDFQAIFPGIKMAFQESSLKQASPGSIFPESGDMH